MVFAPPPGKYFPDEEEEEGPSMSYTVAQHHESMMKAMSENVTTKTMLDVESKVNSPSKSQVIFIYSGFILGFFQQN